MVALDTPRVVSIAIIVGLIVRHVWERQAAETVGSTIAAAMQEEAYSARVIGI